MGALFIFILISALVISAFLFFNKGEKALETKGILKDIYVNLKELFSNFKKLFLIVRELFQDKFKTVNFPSTKESLSSDESTSSSSKEIVSHPSDSNTDSTKTQPELIDKTDIASKQIVSHPSDSNTDSTKTQPELIDKTDIASEEKDYPFIDSLNEKDSDEKTRNF